MLCHISKKISFTELSLVPQVDVFSLHSQILQIPRLLSVLFDANPFKSNVKVVVFCLLFLAGFSIRTTFLPIFETWLANYKLKLDIIGYNNFAQFSQSGGSSHKIQYIQSGKSGCLVSPNNLNNLKIFSDLLKMELFGKLTRTITGFDKKVVKTP